MNQVVSAAALVIRHEPAAQRFVARTDAGEAALQYDTSSDGTLEYYHTFVPPALRGGGIASRLTEYALRYAGDQELKVRPTCPFVARYIDRHPEFQALVA